jgi:hypothetical protein
MNTRYKLLCRRDLQVKLSLTVENKQEFKTTAVTTSSVKESAVKPSQMKQSQVKLSPVKASAVKASQLKTSAVKTSVLKTSPVLKVCNQHSAENPQVKLL